MLGLVVQGWQTSTSIVNQAKSSPPKGEVQARVWTESANSIGEKTRNPHDVTNRLCDFGVDDVCQYPKKSFKGWTRTVRLSAWGSEFHKLCKSTFADRAMAIVASGEI